MSPSDELLGPGLAEVLAETHVELAAARDESDFLRAAMAALGRYSPRVVTLIYVHCDAAGAPVESEVTKAWRDGHLLDEFPMYGRRFPTTMFALASTWVNAPEDLLHIPDVRADPRCDSNLIAAMDGDLGLTALPLWSRRNATWQGMLSIQWRGVHPLTAEEDFVFRLLMKTLSAFIASHRLTQALEAALAERSTPLIPISEEILALPVVGTIDTRRGAQLMETLLTLGGRARVRAAIIDITGVPRIDGEAALVLSRVASALRLRGVEAVLTGIRPEVATTIVTLGLGFESITIRRTVQEALSHVNPRR